MAEETIPLDECVDRMVYRIRSRNLAYGVFRPPTGFIGIREKFGNLYLFEEYYADGSTFGTVYPVEEVGVLPDGIEMRENYDPQCSGCGMPATYDRAIYDRMKVAGWPEKGTHPDQDLDPWSCESGCADVSPYSRSYGPLFDYLLAIEQERGYFPEVIPHETEDPRYGLHQIVGAKDPRDAFKTMRAKRENKDA